MVQVGAALINLDRDQARLAHMSVEAMRVGLTFQRFPAVQGIAVPEWLKTRFFEADGIPVSTLRPGEIGVYASHLCLHKALLDREDMDALLVLEDDLSIMGDLPALLAALDSLPKGWDILKLSNPPKAGFLDHGELATGMHLVQYARVPNNLGAYVISRSGAAKTTQFRGLRYFAIDEDMRRPWDWELETYGILPPPCRANIFEVSSIDSMGARALGKESALDKLKRRRWPNMEGIKQQIRWQIAHLGLLGWLRCILITPVFSLLKRIRGRAWAEGEGGMDFLRISARNLIRGGGSPDP